MHSRSPWWHDEDGYICAKASCWTPALPVSFRIAQVDLTRDDGMDNVQLMAYAPKLLKALQKIDRMSIDVGLDVTLPESPSRTLVYDIHVLAAEAILGTQAEIEEL